MAIVLSIQSQVVRGHVGNSAAQPALQRLGHEVWAVPTVLLSNHPAHGAVAGGAQEPAAIAALVRALPVARCDAVLSGYLGDAANAATVAEAVARARAANRRLLYFCDPVFAHEAGLFVPRAVADAQKTLLRLSDICKPNQTELEDLVGHPVGSLAEAIYACKTVQAWGPRTVILSSLRRSGAPPGVLETLALGPEGAFLVETPQLAGPMHGAGDLFSALFLGFALRGYGTRAALEAAMAATQAVLVMTGAALDLALAAAGDALASPKQRVVARAVT